MRRRLTDGRICLQGVERIRRALFAFTIAAALAVPGLALAHEGDTGNRSWATVTMAAADHVMVKTSDGKELSIAVNAKTKLLKGKTAVKSDALTAGTRVVVTLTAKEPPTAAEIHIGAVPKSDHAT